MNSRVFVVLVTPTAHTWPMWNYTTAATLLFLLLARNPRPSSSENEDLEPNLNRDCSWGSCSENQENPSDQGIEIPSVEGPNFASDQDPDICKANPTYPSCKALGPEWNQECVWDSCPGGQADTLEQDLPECDEDEHSALQKRTPGTLSKLTNFLPNLSKFISDGAKAAYNTVHRLSEDVLEDIGSIVRTVFSEEAYTFVSDLTRGAINSLFSPEQLLGSTLTTFGLKALTLTIILTCILLNYMFLRCVSLLAIVTFDCTVFLLHWLLGPEAVAGIFVYVVMRIYQFFSWLISYPYLFSALIVLLFILSCIWPCVRHIFHRSGRDIALDIERRLVRMEDRLAGIEDMQQKLLDIVNDIKKQISLKPE